MRWTRSVIWACCAVSSEGRARDDAGVMDLRCIQAQASKTPKSRDLLLAVVAAAVNGNDRDAQMSRPRAWEFRRVTNKIGFNKFDFVDY